MAGKGVSTESSPIDWEQFQNLITRMIYDLDNKITNQDQKVSKAKFIMIISIGSYCGLRISDILQIKWIDLSDDCFEVIEKKTGKKRKVTINEDLKLIIAKCKSVLLPMMLDQHIFQNKYGTGTITIQYVNRQLKAIFSKYKINSKKVSSHTLRKTFGLRVFEKNYKSEEALITLSHIFNHSSTAITRRYIGLQAEKIQNVYLSL
ncbi:tyrosine-type recombinase/integrase [Fulvivirga sp.]|uniref:tyrosine-type recombinase/integrase n=1 Tax=Fulvivirga sp. TaxID=1931237 RepID=UPI0032F00950